MQAPNTSYWRHYGGRGWLVNRYWALLASGHLAVSQVLAILNFSSASSTQVGPSHHPARSGRTKLADLFSSWVCFLWIDSSWCRPWLSVSSCLPTLVSWLGQCEASSCRCVYLANLWHSLKTKGQNLREKCPVSLLSIMAIQNTRRPALTSSWFSLKVLDASTFILVD